MTDYMYEAENGATKITAERIKGATGIGNVLLSLVQGGAKVTALFTASEWAELVAKVSASNGMDFAQQVALEFHNTNFADYDSASVQEHK